MLRKAVTEATRFSIGHVLDLTDDVKNYLREVEKLLKNKRAMFRVEKDAPGALNALMRAVDGANYNMHMAKSIVQELEQFARGERGAERQLTYLAKKVGRGYTKQIRGMSGQKFNIAQKGDLYGEDSTSGLGVLMEDLRVKSMGESRVESYSKSNSTDVIMKLMGKIQKRVIPMVSRSLGGVDTTIENLSGSKKREANAKILTALRLISEANTKFYEAHALIKEVSRF